MFIGLSEVAGQYSSLEAGLRSLGVDARFHNLSPNVLSYGANSRRSYRRLLNLRHAEPGSVRHGMWTVALTANRLVRRIRAALLLPWALMRYDLFVLGGHETFLGGADLWLLRLVGKRVVIVFTGSDHRPPYLSGHAIRQHSGDPRALAAATQRLRRRVANAEKWASAIVALPASAQLHRKPFVNLLSVGIAFDPPALPVTVMSEASSDGIEALHCPTDPLAKGSAEIRRAVARCRERGVPITLREITGRPNIEVLEALQTCDFVIDELYSDTPMARFATEAAYYAKPAVVGSYATSAYRDGPADGLPPSLLCHPDDLEDAVTALATDATMRRKLGARAQQFVKGEWASTAVARRLRVVLEGGAPPDWLVEPRGIRYVHGWGLSEAALRATLRRMIGELGVDSLLLAPESKARQLVMDLAQRPHTNSRPSEGTDSHDDR